MGSPQVPSTEGGSNAPTIIRLGGEAYSWSCGRGLALGPSPGTEVGRALRVYVWGGTPPVGCTLSAPTPRRVQFLQQATLVWEGPPAVGPLWLGGKAGGMLLSVLPSLGTLSMSAGPGDDHESHSYSRWKETTVTATHCSHSFIHSINKLSLSSRPEC